MMKVEIIKIHPDARLPKYHSEGAACFDLETIEAAEIAPGEIKLLPTGLVFKAPPGYFLAIVPRSSMFKVGLDQPNSIGVLDPDYCGEKDELKLLVRNFTQNFVKIEKYQRLMQGFFVKAPKIEWAEKTIKGIRSQSRGGFGSTGA